MEENTLNPFISYPDILNCTLEERRELIKDYNKGMERLFPRLQRYTEDVQHARTVGLDPSVVSNLTYNLLVALTNAAKGLSKYDYLKSHYILDDEYDKAYDIWKTFSDRANEIKDLISSIDDCYFDDDTDVISYANSLIPINLNNIDPEAFGIDPNDTSIERIEIDIPTLIAYISTSSSLGVELLKCLKQELSNVEGWLERLKNGIYFDDEEFEDDEEFDRYGYTYLINYNLYRKEYWPHDGANFRSSVCAMNYSKSVSTEFLIEQLKEEKREFVTNPTGRLWRDFIDDKKELYFEAKRIKLNEEQWRYFFRQVCRFEEYDKWIEELRNPPESDEEKLKRERLLKTNKIFNLKPTKSKKEVDILLLYQFIETRFITEKMHVYEWYALLSILRREDVLQNCTVEDFVRQMNDDEWFGHIDKKCKANEINTYNFLNNIPPSAWSIKHKGKGSRASKNSIDRLCRKYIDLEDTIDEIYVKE